MTVVLVDTSVWVDWLRGVDSAASDLLQRLSVDPGSTIATTQPVVMELRAGAPASELSSLEDVLSRAAMLSVNPDLDFAVAADVYRAVRAAGHTPRSTVDCLIAAVTIRHEALLAHRDREFVRMASVVPRLRLLTSQ